MHLRQVAMTTFVLLQAIGPVEKSRRLLERLQPSHVIVYHHDRQDTYYLLSAQEAHTLLAFPSSAPSVDEALHLNLRSGTPMVEGDTDVERAPDQCIVFEEDRLIGFFDITVSPQWISRHRRDELFSLEPEEPTSEVQSLIAEFPERVTLQKNFSLLVSLSAPSIMANIAAFPLALPVGAYVDILVQPKRGFVLDGRNEGMLTVTDEENALPLQFKLRGVTVGPGQIRILAFHQGQPLGRLTVVIDVLETTENTSVYRLSEGWPLESVRNQQPDLSLLILEHTDFGQPAFTFRLTAQDPTLELNLKPFGPIRLKTDVLRYFQDFFQDIETLPLSNKRERAIAEQRLAAKGSQLFTSLLPKELQQLLWSMRSHIQSVLVQSEEPWIPWEICKLQGQENGRTVEGSFLCDAFVMARWLPGVPMRPNLNLKNMAIVVPADSGLLYAQDEQRYLLSLASEKRQVKPIPAKFLELREALASGLHDGWHFTGHGGFRERDPNRSVIYLEHHERFTPEDLSGIVGNLGVARPIVFLNACQIGRSAMSLTDIGGWARQFLHAGAGAFIGTYWSVYDQSAYDFTRALYSRLLIGTPIGKAVQQARVEIKPAGNPTWLAYTLFADPLAIVQE